MKTIAEMMAALAQQWAARRADGGTLYGDPAVELVDAVVDSVTGVTRVRFVFDYMVRHGAQSGSDTYYHHCFVAVVDLQDGEVVAADVESRQSVHVSEYDVEWAPPGRSYDCAVLRRLVDQQWRRELGLLRQSGS